MGAPDRGVDGMSGRVTHGLAAAAQAEPCALCLTVDGLTAGQRHAAKPHEPDVAVSDRCAESEDQQDFAKVAAFRRMAHPKARSAA